MRAAAGPVFVEASDFAELSAAPLMGYELAHNLSLQHDSFDIANLLALFFPPSLNAGIPVERRREPFISVGQASDTLDRHSRRPPFPERRQCG